MDGPRILARIDFAPNYVALDCLPPASDERRQVVRSFHLTLPGYRPTPLRELPRVARRLGLARVLVKDETERLGLPAFKMLGASWAVASEVARWLGYRGGSVPPMEELRSAVLASDAPPTIVAATDGNHGRAVARISALLGLPVRIHVPLEIAAARVDAIRDEGAECVVGPGTWDHAVQRALDERDDQHIVVNDTSTSSSDRDAPTAVMEGYSTIFAELDAQLADLATPTVVAVQIGCGALAAAAIDHFSSREPRPTILGIEAADAECLLRSAARGTATEAPGPHLSVMAGLNCGAPSLIALDRVIAGTDAFIAIGDDPATDAVRVLAEEDMEVGETGAAGLGGVMAVLDADPRRARNQLGLSQDAVLLLFATEGPTDPESFRLALAGSGA